MRSSPSKRSRYGWLDTPHIYKQEPIEDARQAILRIEAEKSALKARRKKSKTKVRRKMAGLSSEPVLPSDDGLPNQQGADVDVVIQTLRRSKVRTVLVE